MLLYCAFGGHLKALHLLAILGGDFLANLMVGTPPPLSPPVPPPLGVCCKLCAVV